MLVTTASASSGRPATTLSGPMPTAPTGNNPPIITPAPNSERHPVYGATPIGRDGFTLEKQMLEMLDFWHKKADGICQEYNDLAAKPISPENEAHFELVNAVSWDLYRAALKVKLRCPKDIAMLLNLIVRHSRTHNETCDADQLDCIAVAAERLSRPPDVRKRVGLLARGDKLTRAGVLFRYHAFLANELRSVGLELYGNDEYALRNTPFEDAVTDRCARRTGRGSHFPFHDQTKLVDRAKAVFAKLRINATEKCGGSR